VGQVIVNLAVNARDAMPDGGRLVLKVGSTELGAEHGLPPGRFAVLSVTDTGSGMDAETAARIFEPFFTTKPDGTGLGLAGAYGIVKQSGGTIWVYSEVGHGSTFKVYLPLVEHAASAATVVPAVTPAREGDGETILLVEDDLHVRAIVAEMLESRNYRVLAAADGEEAISLAEAQGAEIDLLLSDVVMPGLGGRELADRIRALQPSVCVLHMSGYTDDIVIRRGVLDRSAAFIEKPFSSDELARRIRQLLGEPPLAQAA
jgi:CheY-like chemotaxis protein